MMHQQTNSTVSPREIQVLHLLSNGYSSKEIAHQLYVSTYTVNDHRKSLLQKLEVRNVAQMVRKGFELELLNIRNNKL